MSYTRYTNRKNERANDRDAARMTRTEENQLTYKVLSALLAAGLVMSPTAVDASDITDANKQTVYAPTKEGIYNIYAQKIHNKNAINEFEKFQLDANHIANLYFHIEGGTINAENLLNFVNTRIDINGTLNAIKDGKIGGNLFFLSPGGMVVGKSGVINTGSLYVMAPSWTQNLKDKDQRSYEILKGNFATGAYEDTELEGIKNGAANIRINASGTISVLGKINAANDVKLYAGKVAVGKNLLNYDSMLVLTHFKGHVMGGFGGSLKNIAIGCASGKTGKAQLHSDGTNLWAGGPLFMERMVEGGKAITTHFKGHMAYINVLRCMSVDCDCAGTSAAEPTAPNIGILASTDLLAVDQASVDMVYALPEQQRHDLVERIESRSGLRQLEYMETLGMGHARYDLVSLS